MQRHTQLLAAAAVAALAAACSPAISLPVHAGTAADIQHVRADPATEARFCRRFAVFGDSSTYRHLVRVHNSAVHAYPASRNAFGQYQHALLAGLPRKTLRLDLALVFETCQPIGDGSGGPPVLAARFQLERRR
jgi:hypothetical protein